MSGKFRFKLSDLVDEQEDKVTSVTITHEPILKSRTNVEFLSAFCVSPLVNFPESVAPPAHNICECLCDFGSQNASAETQASVIEACLT